MKKIIEVTIAFFFVCVVAVFFSLILWQGLIELAKFVHKFGVNISLVGTPQGIDPGAVIVAVLYLLGWVFAAWYGFRKHKKHLGYTFSVCAPIFAFFVFVQISSLAWF